jgi:hypothetical protein
MPVALAGQVFLNRAPDQLVKVGLQGDNVGGLGQPGLGYAGCDEKGTDDASA